jgi:hypothetical protein
MFLATAQSATPTQSASFQMVFGSELRSRPAHEEEPDLQEAFEDNNYFKPLDPEDFAMDRGWWYRCRHCDSHSRVRSKHPSCRHCGFTHNIQGARI